MTATETHNIDWCINHLVIVNGFTRITCNMSPTNRHTMLLFKDERDVIYVFVTETVVVVTAGGDNVVPTYDVMTINHNNPEFGDDVLQLVLNKF